MDEQTQELNAQIAMLREQNSRYVAVLIKERERLSNAEKQASRMQQERDKARNYRREELRGKCEELDQAKENFRQKALEAEALREQLGLANNQLFASRISGFGETDREVNCVIDAESPKRRACPEGTHCYADRKQIEQQRDQKADELRKARESIENQNREIRKFETLCDTHMRDLNNWFQISDMKHVKQSLVMAALTKQLEQANSELAKVKDERDLAVNKLAGERYAIMSDVDDLRRQLKEANARAKLRCNDKPWDPPTRERIQALIKAINYKP